MDFRFRNSAASPCIVQYNAESGDKKVGATEVSLYRADFPQTTR